jgi:hypothetical protein
MQGHDGNVEEVSRMGRRHLLAWLVGNTIPWILT